MTDPKAKGKECVEKVIDKATEMFLEPVLKYIGNLCSDFTGYLADFDDHVRDLREAARDLSAERESLQTRVVCAESRAINMKESPTVKEWYGKVEAARRDAATLEEKGKREEGRLCLGKWCVGRLCYGKNVVTCCKRLKKLKEEGKNITDEELLEQGARKGYERLGSFKDKFRKLGYEIKLIEELRDIVGSSLQYAKDTKTTIANDDEIGPWLREVTSEVNEGKSYIQKKEDCIKKFQSLGSGSTDEDLHEVKECIKRIANWRSRGKIFLDNLRDAVGSGASCSNEAPPQPQPQPQPQLA